jgi:hypothetical protein
VPCRLEVNDVAARWVVGLAESFESSVVGLDWVDPFAPWHAYAVVAGDASFAGDEGAIALVRRWER